MAQHHSKSFAAMIRRNTRRAAAKRLTPRAPLLAPQPPPLQPQSPPTPGQAAKAYVVGADIAAVRMPAGYRKSLVV